VRSWKEKWGFIVSDSFEGDLFAHMDYLVQPGLIPTQGARVSFEVGTGQKNRPSALQIQILTGGVVPQVSAMPAQFQAAPMQSLPMQQPPAEPGMGRASEEVLSTLVGQRMEGTMRSWKDVWGFVTCPHFSGDLFAHIENTVANAPLATGSLVVFEVGVDKKGRHTAQRIESISKPEHWVGKGLCKGTLKSWRDSWGFIISGQFAGDLFCHVMNVNPQSKGQLALGAPVSFTVEMDEKGRLTARQVRVEGGAPMLQAMPQLGGMQGLAGLPGVIGGGMLGMPGMSLPGGSMGGMLGAKRPLQGGFVVQQLKTKMARGL